MENEISEIKQEVLKIRQELIELKELVRQLLITCSRMDEHISFVNKTYNTVRKPFALVLNTINRTIGNGEQQTLPHIENSR